MDALQRAQPGVVLRALERIGALCAVGAAACLNVLGWMLALRGPWRLGLLVLILSVQLLGIVLWESAAR
jgi:hypothetical protein